MPDQEKHYGCIAIIGRPNVGKSTLMNAIIGTKLSIVTPKPQTTRKNVLGVYTEGNTQMTFLDTPGVLTPRYELHRSMMENVRVSLESADAVLVVVDVSLGKPAYSFLTQEFREALAAVSKPIFMALNKMDALDDKKIALPMMDEFRRMNIFCELFAISALQDKFVKDMLGVITGYLPEGEFGYDPEQLSDRTERFFVAELIRETVFMAFDDEIPYSVEVAIAEFRERERGKWYIAADIIVERESQKKILIGAKGTKIKEIGASARKKAEEHLEHPVFLELFVKVREHWRERKATLRGLGY
ncbi:GTPase Era [Ignavibacteria bacterium]|nr:GTPase Era [Bacteroidota bacterium]MCZ2131692.1 GTPase Era [Bacteroidota bacterium]